MGKHKRGGFIFKMWIGDHLPRHVHVFKDGKLLVKWDMEKNRAIEGQVTSKILKALQSLIEEGKL